MADFTYKTVTVTGADTLEEAQLQAVTSYLSQFGEPTQQEIDNLLAEIGAEALERLDLDSLQDDITNQIDWTNTTIPEIDSGIAAVGAFTNAAQRAIVLGLLQNQRRIVLIIRGVLKAFRFIIRKVIQ